jgi:hypothetical protein
MDKIIFTFNNSDIHHDYASMAMVVFEILLEKNPAPVGFYIKKLGFFDQKDFHNLNERIQLKPQPQVPMNEKHFLMFYAVIRYSCRAFYDKDEKHLLFEYAREIPDEFNGIRDKVQSFSDVVTEKFKREYIHLKSFKVLLQKIEDFDK